ncbi:MAG: hypothetical protein HC778_05610 [Chamaesiphon sp. CSU_1_12]|nr:hypothetical protein [Chamaesiphon sp. CSU_1_12]
MSTVFDAIGVESGEILWSYAANLDAANVQFAQFSYGYDKNDNLLYEARAHQGGQGEVYSYDKSDRLTNASRRA